MELKNKLPVTYLLFTKRGRINRMTYWTASIFLWSCFYVLFNVIEYTISYSATIVIYPLLYWGLFCTANKRLHDVGLSGYWLWLIIIPVFGPLVLFFLLGFRRGSKKQNKFGPNPNLTHDYFVNSEAEAIKHLKTGERIVNDVSRLNPVIVSRVEKPTSTEDLQDIIRETKGAISIGGGRFSMGGQTASPYSTHIDMRSLNHVLEFSAENKTIKVEAGIRWCDIQQYVDPHNLSVMIMQSYANFTVGGSLSVNCHGRYIGLGALILSVRSVDLVLPNGEMVHASRTENPDLFAASVGCYNAIGVIASVELSLEENLPMERVHKLMPRENYRQFFADTVRNDKDVILHNGDLYPPDFKQVRGVSWVKTTRKPTEKARLMPLAASYPLERYFISSFSKSDFAKWRRQHIYDPFFYLRKKVHWRNYEAGYDVAELEPSSRDYSSYILQEYFVPVDKFDQFADDMAEIVKRHKINVINVSIRHAVQNNESLLSWARQEVFAFVIWYKQSTNEKEKNKVGVWTRELIDAAIASSGSYYLPYQPHATREQFHLAYPDAHKLFGMKDRIDPGYKFRNVLWDTYYEPNNPKP